MFSFGKWISLSVLLALLGVVNSAEARIGVCGNRPLPPDRIRHLKSLRLECASSVDHYIRTPQPFDIKAWRTLDLGSKPNKKDLMQELMRKLDPIQWKGSIPYETIEAWTWEEEVYGQDISCGTEEVPSGTDEKGNTTYTTQIASCWHDETRYENRPCSVETVNFEANYERPTHDEWKPGIKYDNETWNYYDVIGNKYDLLPGEVEDVQIFSNYSQSTQVYPWIDIGDKWNEYTYSMTMDDGQYVHNFDRSRGKWNSTATCLPFRQPINLRVKIYTEHRLQKQTPNAFRPPLDRFGRQIDPFVDNDINSGEEGRPTKIGLTDASDTLIATMAKNSREAVVAIEKAKLATGKGRTTAPEDLRKFEKEGGYLRKSEAADKEIGFFQETQVRVKLYLKRAMFGIDQLARDSRATHAKYARGADVADGGAYRIGLVSDDPKDNLYQASGPFHESTWNKLNYDLIPGEKYVYKVAMYQKDMPFYAQDCENEKYRHHWNCKLGFRGEDAWFSKELPLEYVANPKVDQRGLFQTLNDFQDKSWGQQFKSVGGMIGGFFKRD